MNRLLGLLGCLLLGGLGVACGGGGSSESTSTIKIALEAPLSGDQSSNGIDMFNGAALAVEEANRGGGVDGKRLELVRADDKADPATGVQVAKQMVSDHVFAVVGPYNSSVGVENLKIYVNAGVIPIHLTSNSATNGEGYTIQPKDYQIAPVNAKAITGFFHANSVGIVYDPSTYTAGIAGQLRTALEHAGVDVVAYERVNTKLHDYATLLAGVERRHPDLLFVSTYYPQGGVIAKDYSKLPHRPTCLMGLANQDPGFVSVAGLDTARLCSFTGVPSAENFPGAKKYVADYRARFGKAPGTWGTFTYDSVKLLIDAVQRAGGWDAGKVRQELTDTRDYTGITGSITIDPKTGNRVNVPVVILKLEPDGIYVVDPKWAAFAGFSS
jgi:branched-chain amino acid transport system substrate-binding protein